MMDNSQVIQRNKLMRNLINHAILATVFAKPFAYNDVLDRCLDAEVSSSISCPSDMRCIIDGRGARAAPSVAECCSQASDVGGCIENSMGSSEARERHLIASSVPLCDVTFDVMQVQDTTNSFIDVVNYMKGNMTSLVDSIISEYPTSRYGLTSFADKTLPWLGWGWGDVEWNLIKDSCYEMQQPLTTESRLIQQSIQNIRISGGNDPEENAFDALLQTVVRPSVGWRTETFDGLKAVIRAAFVVTDAPSHVAGNAAEWIGYWNENWGMDSTLDPSWDLFPTGYPPQFSYHQQCKGDIQSAYKRLGPMIRSGTVADGDRELAQDVLDKCNPIAFPEPVPHHGGVSSNLECTTLDYPSVKQVVEQLMAHQVNPVVLVPSDTYTGSLAWYKWLGYCKKASTEADCVVEYYKEQFGKYPDLNFIVAKMDGAEHLAELILDYLGSLKDDLCDKYHPDQWPTVEPITPVPTENPDKCIVNFESKCGSCEEVAGSWELTDGLWVCYVNGEPIASVAYNCTADEIQCCTNAVNSGLFGGVLNVSAIDDCAAVSKATTVPPTITTTVPSSAAVPVTSTFTPTTPPVTTTFTPTTLPVITTITPTTLPVSTSQLTVTTPSTTTSTSVEVVAEGVDETVSTRHLHIR